MFRTAIERLRSMDRRTPSFSANVIYQFAGRALSFVLGIGVSIIVARYLGPKGKGIVNTLQTFLSFYGTIVLLGVPTALQYFIANRKYPIRVIIGTFCSFVLYSFFPLTFLLVFLTPHLTSTFLKSVPPLLLRVSLLFSLLTVYLTPLGQSLLGLRRFNYIFFVGSLNNFLRLAFLAFFLILLKWGVWGAFASDWLLILLNIPIGFYILGDAIRLHYFIPHLDKTILKDMLKYGLPIFLGGILWQVNARFDVFVVNSYWGASAVGLYMTGVNYTELLRLFTDSVNSVLFPQIASIPPGEARPLTSFLSRISPLYFLPLAFLLYFLSPLIIPLFFGSAFRPSITVVPYLLPGIISWIYLGFLWNHLAGRGYPHFNLYGSLVGSISTLLLDFLLIPRWGIIGASIASSIAYTLTFLVVLHFFKKLENLSFSEIFLPRKKDFIILMEKMKEMMKAIRNFRRGGERDTEG
jgi:O-antigen/teichoic acid export membrane protein